MQEPCPHSIAECPNPPLPPPYPPFERASAVHWREGELVRWRGLYASDILDNWFQLGCVFSQLAAGYTALFSQHTVTPPAPGPACNSWSFGTTKYSPWFLFELPAQPNFPLFFPSPFAPVMQQVGCMQWSRGVVVYPLFVAHNVFDGVGSLCHELGGQGWGRRKG